MFISFLSDFGRQDEFVGVVHGVIARIAPEIRVIDVTHDIAPGDIRAGALSLLRAVQYVPQGVMLAVVDPGVGTNRKPIAASTPWGVFIGPDNGLLAPAVAMVGGADQIHEITNPELILPAEGATFQGRDLFAPAAAVIASGQATIDQLGDPVDANGVTPLMIPLVEPDGSGGLIGEVLWVDRFGNAQTNLTPDDLAGLGLEPGDDVVLRIGASEFRLSWATAYGDVEPGEGLVHVDSYGQIAVAVREGRADESFPLATRVAVTMARPAGGKRIDLQGVKPLD
jgi:S-adenosylmethionine hydrolase